MRHGAHGKPWREEPLRLLAMVQRQLDHAPNQRFRHEQWAPHLERNHGISLTFAPFESPELSRMLETRGRRGRKLLLATRDFYRRWRRRYDVDAFDGVVVLREASMLGGSVIEDFVVRRGIPLIYDFDDPIWLSRPDGGHWVASLVRAPWKVPHICRIASAVTVGNEYLAAFARRHNANVNVVRTSIDLDRFRILPPRPASDPFTILWTGSKSTLQYLELVRPALETLGARMPLRLRVVCDVPPPQYGNVRLDYVKWSPSVEVSSLAAGDVGIMPLPDTATARGKCACKVLQYMAVGRPTVLSPVGFNRQLVRDGENGLFADTQENWISQIERLALDAGLRRRLAQSGRSTIETGYSSTLSANAFAVAARAVVAPRTMRRNQSTA